VLGLARAPSWVVLSGPARHGWAGSVPCSVGIGSPLDGTARPGLSIRAQTGLAWAGSSRVAHLDIYNIDGQTGRLGPTRHDPF
jgi:hypothetical protein